MAGNPIYDAIERDILGATHEISDWFHPHHSASQAPAATPVTVDTATAKENPMGFVTDVKNDLATAAHELAAKAADFETVVLPGIAGKLTALEGNPVVDSLLNAVHVPPEALDIIVKTIDGLEALYNPAQPAQAPAVAAAAQ